MLKFIIITIASLATLGCASATKSAKVADQDGAKTAREADQKTGLTANYRDVNGNVFKFFTRNGDVHFAYIPMTPVLSSSGTYSGGAPNKGILSAEQVKALRGHFDALHNNRAVHSKLARKGTGSIHFSDGASQGVFAVQMSALKSLNTFLAPLRGGE